jgi:hypothetical protein
MQLDKKTQKRYSPIYIDNEGGIRFYKKNQECINYKTLKTCQNFLDKQPEEIKGYKEDILTEKYIVFGLPKGVKYTIRNEIPSEAETH